MEVILEDDRLRAFNHLHEMGNTLMLHCTRDYHNLSSFETLKCGSSRTLIKVSQEITSERNSSCKVYEHLYHKIGICSSS
jgi:hypothetical protein